MGNIRAWWLSKCTHGTDPHVGIHSFMTSTAHWCEYSHAAAWFQTCRSSHLTAWLEARSAIEWVFKLSLCCRWFVWHYSLFKHNFLPAKIPQKKCGTPTLLTARLLPQGGCAIAQTYPEVWCHSSLRQAPCIQIRSQVKRRTCSPQVGYKSKWLTHRCLNLCSVNGRLSRNEQKTSLLGEDLDV